MTTTPKPCGTTAAYSRHISRGEEPCADCRRAWAEARRKSREDPDKRAKYNRQMRARNRALSRLAKRHPAMYLTLYAEELDR